VAGGFDLVSAVASASQDRYLAWVFIERFVAGWHRPLIAADGWSRRELEAAVRDLGTRFPTVTDLPAALAETYVMLGRRRDVTSNRDQLLDPTQLCLDDSGEVLVVRRESQGRAQWGILLGDLCRDDPPVVMQVAGPQSDWRPYADRWSLACIEMVLFESLWSRPDLTSDVELDDGAVALVERRYTPLPVPVLLHWTLEQVRWFTGPDILLRDEARIRLMARARTRQAFDDARRALSG
jgi:hypothetical protein